MIQALSIKTRVVMGGAIVSLSIVGVIGWHALPNKSSRTPFASRGVKVGTASQETSPAAKRTGSKEVAPPLPVGTPDRGLSSLLVSQIQSALRSQDDADWNRVLNELYPALIKQDCQAAAHLLETLPADARRDRLMRRLARAWATVDFAGALNWITKLPSPTDQKAAFEDACFGATDNDPVEAIHAWETFDPGLENNVLVSLVQSWATKDLRAAQDWVEKRPASEQRDQVVARIAYVMAQSESAQAAAFVTHEIKPGPAQTEAIISVLQMWAQHDLAGATAWAASFTDAALRDRAIGELAGITPASH